MFMPVRVLTIAQTKRSVRRLLVALAIAALATPSIGAAPAVARQVTFTAESAGTTSIEAATRAPGTPNGASPEFVELVEESGDVANGADLLNRSPGEKGEVQS